MIREPKVSVIIVNWNGQKWLKRCLDSLLAQTYKNYEIILVDNGSTDDSVSFVNAYYSVVKVIQSEQNLGFAGGNNLGIKAAKGEYILLLNNDTWVESDFIFRLVDAYQKGDYDVVAPLEADYSGVMTGPHRTLIDPLGHPVYVRSNKPSTADFYLSGVCVLFSKDLYGSTLGLDDNFFMYFEEIDWFWRLNLLGKKYRYVEDLWVNHAGAGSTGRGIKYQSFLWRNQNCLQMILKNYAVHNLLWVVPLYLIQNIVEALVFFVLLKPKIALSYPLGWWFNMKNIGKILIKRKQIQCIRTVTDLAIIKRMYWGPGKLHHLGNYLKNHAK